MPTVHCPGCRSGLRVAAELAGRSVRCPNCARMVPLPRLLPPDSRTPPPADTDAEAVAPEVPRFRFLHPPRTAGELGWLGGYRVLRVLGQGGMGVVFVAEDLGLERRVALKVMRPEAAAHPLGRQRFLREARAVAALLHDHIVPIYQTGEDNGVPFLVMPLLNGEPLSKRLDRDGALPLAEALRIGREIAEGLAAAHGVGVMHRDVKPANVWLEAPNGRVRLLDFGLARATDAGGEVGRLTVAGTVLGTPAYMAPEQTGKNADHRADLFSLGVVLYEMLTGQRPFDGPTPLAVLACVAAFTPPPPDAVLPGLPAEVSQLVQALLAKKPEQRPATARAVVQRLRALRATSRSAPAVAVTAPLSLPPTAPATPPPQPPPRRRRLLPLLLTVLAVALLATLPSVWFLLYRHPHHPHHAEAAADKDQGGQPKDGAKAEEAPRPPEVITNSLGMKLRWIPAGTFRMGSPEGEPERGSEEVAHNVTLTRPFYLGAFLVTQKQYQELLHASPSHFKGADDLPVDSVSYNDATRFCRALSQAPEEKRAGRVYRLPTEAEWEYACRAGTTTPFWFGDGITAEQANYDASRIYGRGRKGLFRGKTTRVDAFPPNPWGLHDMHGNLYQWCADWYGPYDRGPVTDPTGPKTGKVCVLRGGAWVSYPTWCRAASRNDGEPTDRFDYTGFRVVCQVEPQKAGAERPGAQLGYGLLAPWPDAGTAVRAASRSRRAAVRA